MGNKQAGFLEKWAEQEARERESKPSQQPLFQTASPLIQSANATNAAAKVVKQEVCFSASAAESYLRGLMQIDGHSFCDHARTRSPIPSAFTAGVLEYLTAVVLKSAGDALKEEMKIDASIEPTVCRDKLLAAVLDGSIESCSLCKAFDLDCGVGTFLQKKSTPPICVLDHGRLVVSSEGMAAFFSSLSVEATTSASIRDTYVSPFVAAANALTIRSNGICEALCGESEALLPFVPYSRFWSRAQMNLIFNLNEPSLAGTNTAAPPYLPALAPIINRHSLAGEAAEESMRIEEQIVLLDFVIKYSCELILQAAQGLQNSFPKAVSLLTVPREPLTRFNQDSLTNAINRCKTAFESRLWGMRKPQPSVQLDTRCVIDLELTIGDTIILESELKFVFTTSPDELTWNPKRPVGFEPLVRKISTSQRFKGYGYYSHCFSPLAFRTLKLVVDVVLRELVSLASAESITGNATEPPTISAGEIEKAYQALLAPLFGPLPAEANAILDAAIVEDGVDCFFRSDLAPFSFQESAKLCLLKIVCLLLEPLVWSGIRMTRHSNYWKWRSLVVVEALMMSKASSGSSRAVGIVFRHCLLKHLGNSTAQTTISILGIVARKDLMQFYTMIMRNMYLFSIEDIVMSITSATRREKLRLLDAFRDISSPNNANIEDTLATKKKEEDDPFKSFPIDPRRWIDVDTERRRQFALPALPEELVQKPFLELYNAFSEDDYSTLKIPIMLPKEITKELLLTHSWLGETQSGSQSSRVQSIVSASTFASNWQLCSGGQFEGVDMRGVFIAGGSVLTCLLPNCNADTLGSSDIDLFVYGLTCEQATERALEVLAAIAERRRAIKESRRFLPFRAPATTFQALIHDAVNKLAKSSSLPSVLAKSKHALTLVGDEIFRPVQFILRAYRSPAEILLGFDVDCCAVGLALSQTATTQGPLTTTSDSAMMPQVYVGPRAWRAITTMVNCIDLTRRSPTYEKRLEKYAKRGFAVFAGTTSFRRNNVSSSRVWLSRCYNPEVDGLTQILYADYALRNLQTQDGRVKRELSPGSNDKAARKNWKVFSQNFAEEYGYDRSYIDAVNQRLKPLIHCADYSKLSTTEVAAIFGEKDANEGKDDVRGKSGAGKEVSKEESSEDCRVFRIGRKDSLKFVKFITKEQVLSRLSPEGIEWMTDNPGKQDSSKDSQRLPDSTAPDLLTGSFTPLDAKEDRFLQQQSWSSEHHPRVSDENEGVPLLLFGGTGRYESRSVYEMQPGLMGRPVFAGSIPRFEMRRPFDLSLNQLNSADTARQLAPSFYQVLKRLHPTLVLSSSASDLLCELLASCLDKLALGIWTFFFRPVMGEMRGVDMSRFTIEQNEVSGAVTLLLSEEVSSNTIAKTAAMYEAAAKASQALAGKEEKVGSSNV